MPKKQTETKKVVKKEADITKAFNTLDKHIDESKLSTATKTLLSNFENAIDDKDSKKLKSIIVMAKCYIRHGF
jgi:uncharacterized protein YpiB (UPF0302 family)